MENFLGKVTIKKSLEESDSQVRKKWMKRGKLFQTGARMNMSKCTKDEVRYTCWRTMTSSFPWERVTWRRNDERWRTIQTGKLGRALKTRLRDLSLIYSYILFICFFSVSHSTNICWKPVMCGHGASHLKMQSPTLRSLV